MRRRGRPPYPDVLTPREWEVLELLRAGRSNEEIADRLGISIKGAEYHVSEILGKLGVADRRAAARWQAAPQPARGFVPLLGAALSRLVRGRWLARAPAIAAGGIVVAGAAALLAFGVLVWRSNHGAGGPAPSSANTQPAAPAALAPTSPTAVAARWTTSDATFVSAAEGWLVRQRPGQGEVWHTSDGGQTWRQQYSGAVELSQVRFAGPSDGWAAGSTGPDCDTVVKSNCHAAILTTRDGGKTWRQEAAPGVSVNVALKDEQDGWVVATGCPDGCAQASTADLFRTTDGGLSWQTVDPAPGGRGVLLTINDANSAWVETDSGIAVTRDDGATWATFTDPCLAAGTVRPAALQFLQEMAVWVVCWGEAAGTTQDKALYVSTDGGSTWTLMARSVHLGARLPDVGQIPGGVIRALVVQSETDGWLGLAGPGPNFLETHDQGSTWTPVAAFPRDFGVTSISVTPDRTGIVVLWNAGLLVTGDSGATWRSVALPPAD